jgi:hypothetical protein
MADKPPSPPLATSAKDAKAQREDEIRNSREKAQKTQKEAKKEQLGWCVPGGLYQSKTAALDSHLFSNLFLRSLRLFAANF